MRSLQSGIKVICTSEWTYEAFLLRLSSSLQTQDGMTTLEIALQWPAQVLDGVGVGVIESMVNECEAKGAIWRDEVDASIGNSGAHSATGPRWWLNVCTADGWQWDGQD